MINKLIEFCANNRFIVLLFVSMAVFAGLYSIKNINLDAVPRSLRHAGHYLYRWDRSPDIIEDRHLPNHLEHARRAAGKRHTRLLRFWFSYVYIIFEEGTDILLGPIANA